MLAPNMAELPDLRALFAELQTLDAVAALARIADVVRLAAVRDFLTRYALATVPKLLRGFASPFVRRGVERACDALAAWFDPTAPEPTAPTA